RFPRAADGAEGIAGGSENAECPGRNAENAAPGESGTRKTDWQRHRFKEGLRRRGGTGEEAAIPRPARRGDRFSLRGHRIVALMQIAEPGMSPEPHQARLAVGIDLGTTNSLVATVRSGAPVVLPDAHGRPLLPSIVRYRPDGRVEVGYAA